MNSQSNETPAAHHNRASVSSKIFLLVATFSLPIGVLAWLLAANYTPQIETAQLERKGNQLQKPLMTALNGLLKSAEVARACVPGECASQLAGQRGPVETALNDAVSGGQQYTAELALDASSLAKAGHPNLTPSAIQEEWKALAAEAAGNGTDQNLAARYVHVAEQITQLVGYVGNSSSLILDPDLDSYYLVDVTLLTMPETFTRIARTAALGNQVVKGASAVQQAALVNETSLLQQAVDRVAASNRTTLEADAANHGVSPSLEPTLHPALQRYSAAVSAYVATLKSIGEDPTRVSAEALAAQSASLQEASLEYWNIAAGQLDTLLNIRVADFQRNRIQALGFSALAVFAAAFVAFLLGRSITKPLNELVRDLAPGATLLGVSVERIAEASRSQTPDQEEAAIICEELNAHADSMRNAVLQLARHVQGSAASEMVSGANGQRKA